MTDIFISYSHDDQPFVRRMVSSLESEGFSVWWDHTIPPGQTWDSFIARGIEQAKTCIVVWSPHSAESDWVKEEATLAKDAGKLLPVSIDGAQPPVGFRRMQAADLSSWSGDLNHAQWQLLVGAVRALLAGGAQPRSHAPRQSYAPVAAPKRSFPIATLGVVAAVSVVGVLAWFFARPVFEGIVPQETEIAASTESVVPAATNSAPETQEDNPELERLRRERDAAVSAQREAQGREAAREREAAAERARAAAEAAATPPSFVGTWAIDEGPCGSNTFTLNAGGGFTANGYTGRWRQTGRDIYLTITETPGWEFNGAYQSDGRITGTIGGSAAATNCGAFTMTRQ